MTLIFTIRNTDKFLKIGEKNRGDNKYNRGRYDFNRGSLLGAHIRGENKYIRGHFKCKPFYSSSDCHNVGI